MDVKYTDEFVLVEHLKMGRSEAFHYLVDIYSRPLFAYALSLSNDKAMAQDIVQNVFMRAWEKRKRITINSSIKNYLFKSTYNEFLNQYGKNRSKRLLERKYAEFLEKTAERLDENNMDQILKEIAEGIQKLPPKCREVFIMSRTEGLTNTEISDYLNISIKTVEAHITKAFSLLRKSLGTKMEGILFLLFGPVILYPKKS